MLRNKEVKVFLIQFTIVFLILLLIGTQLGIEAVLLLIVSSLAYFLIFYFFTRNRYLKIAHISEQIDCVLYNTEYLYIGKQEEGELSILECEI